MLNNNYLLIGGSSSFIHVATCPISTLCCHVVTMFSFLVGFRSRGVWQEYSGQADEDHPWRWLLTARTRELHSELASHYLATACYCVRFINCGWMLWN